MLFHIGMCVRSVFRIVSSCFFSLRHFGYWNISVIFLTVVLKLALNVFFNLYFQTFWPKWLHFFGFPPNEISPGNSIKFKSAGAWRIVWMFQLLFGGCFVSTLTATVMLWSGDVGWLGGNDLWPVSSDAPTSRMNDAAFEQVRASSSEVAQASVRLRPLPPNHVPRQATLQPRNGSGWKARWQEVSLEQLICFGRPRIEHQRVRSVNWLWCEFTANLL